MAEKLPQEIIDRIIDEIALDGSSKIHDQTRDMKTLSLVSSKWHERSREHLFKTVEITSDNFPAWCRTVRPGSDGPSRHITYLRYRPSWVKLEQKAGPLEGLDYSYSHRSAFTNLRTLHFAEISLQHTSYWSCLGRLTTIRELWLEDCQTDITHFVPFIRPFTNLDRLRLMRPRCASESKLQHWDMADPPPLRGTLEFHQASAAASMNTASFIHEFSLMPAHFSTMVFRERLDTPGATNRLLSASRKTLTKLTFGHNTIPKGINLTSLGILKELELSTLVVKVLPPLLRTVKSGDLESIRFFLLVHQLERDVEDPIPREWLKLDLELFVLANRLQAANRYYRGNLQVKFTDIDPTTPAWLVEETARQYLPRSHEHEYISFSVG